MSDYLKSLSDTELNNLMRLVHEKTGNFLDPAKRYLVESRLHAMESELGCRNKEEFFSGFSIPEKIAFAVAYLMF